MSEELIQKKLTKHGQKMGRYEFYNIGATNLSQLRDYHIISNKPYAGFLANKPDGLLVDRNDLKNISVIAVLEYKTPEEFNTPSKKQEAFRQCIEDYCKPLEAKIGIVTDGTEYVWLNPQVVENEVQAEYSYILREDGYPLQLPFAYSNEVEIEISLEIIEKILKDISPISSQLQKPYQKNPSNLADRVWQTIWLASGENPDGCLATFVEIFVFKYLSDLNILVRNNSGVRINFADNLTVDRDKCLIFYFEHIRPFIKQLFPAGRDDTSIINGIILDPKVKEHNLLFYTILEEFNQFGLLRDIDPEFKSRLYENFLKKSISQKNWGQFFTPRNVVKAIIEMSEIEHLPDGAKVHDPACGVGGFILEPVNTKRSRDYSVTGKVLKRKLHYSGFDRDQKTIILAKANMLIHLNELVKINPDITNQFAQIFNDTFISMHRSILGSIGQTPVDEYDLIMTNPPFVVTGTSQFKDFIKRDGTLNEYYKVSASGVEGLFLEQIIKSLKPGGRAFVITPDGILNRLTDNRLRRFILDKCILEAIISLPRNTFYTTPKKTYILALRKKLPDEVAQTTPVFSYIITHTGETLDARRFPDKNDLPEMVKLFKYFKADELQFSFTGLKCKIWNIDQFLPERNWSIDRWWSENERRELGVLDEQSLISVNDFTSHLQTEKQALDNAINRLHALKEQWPELQDTVDIGLSDVAYFQLGIGKRVLKRDIYNEQEGKTPLYSANVSKPFGFVNQSNLSNFDHDCVIWSIDGKIDFNVILRNQVFATTDHCGIIRILSENIDPDYLCYSLLAIRFEVGFDRELRANLQNMKNIAVKFPVLRNDSGSLQQIQLDISLQKQIASFYKTIHQIKSEIASRMEAINKLTIEPNIL